MTPWLALLVLASPAGAQPVDVDGLVAAQRETLRSAMRLDCPPAGADEEIVVCGSRDPGREHRLPLPVAREPRAGDRAAGEQRAALDIDSSRCTPVGRAQQCSGGLDVIGIAFTMARALGQALADED
ncbi:hypothetical protein [Sphingosinicella sp. CPCC 101087]|uniref:hypothetical protein n=1 Tax=Sphingosinicella sp. CPCC 101087 TaxID=2497754 RepID=UPI001981794D|nr:hypothetical protein [Sphingosinicella sp. CPCC 101087]